MHFFQRKTLQNQNLNHALLVPLIILISYFDIIFQRHVLHITCNRSVSSRANIFNLLCKNSNSFSQQLITHMLIMQISNVSWSWLARVILFPITNKNVHYITQRDYIMPDFQHLQTSLDARRKWKTHRLYKPNSKRGATHPLGLIVFHHPLCRNQS